MATASTVSLVGGNIALDLANTLSGRESSPFEHLHDADDVVDWAAHAGAADPATVERCRADLSTDAKSAERTLDNARRLRGAIYGAAAAIAHGGEAPRSDLAALKEFARKAIGSAELVPGGDGRYRFDFSQAPVETALLGPIALAAVEMLAAGHFERLKQCPNHECGWLFFDHSKNNSRRWCDMATCGNRSKVKRHRERR